jgi:hypothetical protein
MLGRRLCWGFVLMSVALVELILVSGRAQAQGRSGGGNIGTPPQLEAQLIMYNDEYLVREPIPVKIQVSNVGEEAGQFYFVTFDGLVIEDAEGKEYPSNILLQYSPITIKSGDTLEQEFDILSAYGLPEDSFHVRWYLPPERYTVYYSLRKDAKSEACTFVVSLPEGDELKAMNLLKESHDLRIQRKDEESLDKLKELVGKYPKSRYYLCALLKSAGNLEAWHDLIERFPNSREAVRAVGSIALTYLYRKDKQGYVGAMNDLIKQHPDSDIASEAEKHLKQMRDKDFE